MINNNRRPTENYAGGNQYQPQRVGISRTYEIVQTIDDTTTRPFYIYRFSINRARKQEHSEDNDQAAEGDKNDKEIENASCGPNPRKESWRIRKLVLEKALNNWLDKRKPESQLHLSDLNAQMIYTQFVFTDPDELSLATQDDDSDWHQDHYEQQVTVQVNRLVDSVFVPVDEKYIITFKMLLQPIMELNKRNLTKPIEMALNFMLLADVQNDPAFGDTRLSRVFKLADRDHKRMSSLGSCLVTCLGLRTSIMQVHTRTTSNWRQDNEFQTLVRLDEATGLFFNEMNMIELLKKHFKFDVNVPLEPAQIEELQQELSWQLVELRPDVANNGHEEEPQQEYHVTCVAGVTEKPVMEELCDFVDEKTGKKVENLTVEQQFMREYPHHELKYKNMPCLISPKGRRMAMEICWIKLDRTLRRRLTRDEMFELRRAYSERTDIFDDNCKDLINGHSSTLEKFGFTLKPCVG